MNDTSLKRAEGSMENLGSYCLGRSGCCDIDDMIVGGSRLIDGYEAWIDC